MTAWGKGQWVVILTLLAANLLCLYGVIIPLGVTWSLDQESAEGSSDGDIALAAEMTTEVAEAPALSLTPGPVQTLLVIIVVATRDGRTPSPTRAAILTFTPPSTAKNAIPTASPKPTQMPTPTSQATQIKSPTAMPRKVPAPTITHMPTQTSSPAATATEKVTATVIATRVARQSLVTSVISPRALARLELDPGSRLASKTTFFTSACFGEGANPLQDKDYMAPADWSSSPDRKCIFGFAVNPGDGMPAGRYSVFGGPDGQPRFYVVPPDAFAQDLTHVKQLSGVQLIVDPDQGCDALGSFGITADGATYQCPACALLRSGGYCPVGDGSKSIYLPTSRNTVLNPNENGGARGFVNYPLVLFRKGFSVYFTGKAGYAPPRTYFESQVETLYSSAVKTTAEMSDRELKEVAEQYDSAEYAGDPTIRLAAFEQEAPLTSSGQVTLRSRERGEIAFTAPVGAVLSSIAWKIRPLTNQTDSKFLETNLCLDLNGEETCFTGVEDFAHCAFYAECKTGYSSLVSIGQGGYLATRYFSPGAAPVIHDPTIAAKFLAPDIGTVIEIEVNVRVRYPRVEH